VACDSTASLYYHNLEENVEDSESARLAYNEDGREQGGMGAAATDSTVMAYSTFQDKLRDDTHTCTRTEGNNFEDDTIAQSGSKHKISGWEPHFLTSTMTAGRT